MSQSPETSPELEDRLAELKETKEREKVQLTPEVEGYIQEHVKAIQNKLANGEAILESDLEFIDEVKLWMSMSEEWRGKLQSIEAKNEFTEAAATDYENGIAWGRALESGTNGQFIALELFG